MQGLHKWNLTTGNDDDERSFQELRITPGTERLKGKGKIIFFLRMEALSTTPCGGKYLSRPYIGVSSPIGQRYVTFKLSNNDR